MMEVEDNFLKLPSESYDSGSVFGRSRSVSTSTPVFGRTLSSASNDGDRLQLPLNNKHRSISDSVLSSNDSGYADSLADSTFGSPAFEDTTVCRTREVTPITGVRCHSQGRSLVYSPEIFSPSPFNSKHNQIVRQSCIRHIPSPSECKQNINVGQSSHESNFTDWQFAEEERVFEKLRCSNKNLNIPKLDLDIDIDDNGGNNVTPNPNSSGLSEHFNKVLRKFSPSEPDRLIGRKIGLENVDVLSELYVRGVPCVKSILAYLHPSDICRMCQVNKEWNIICETDKSSCERRKKFKKHKNAGITGKENVGKKTVVRRNDRGLTEGVNALLPVQCVGTCRSVHHIPETPKTRTHRDVFMEVARTLKNDEKLQHCPRCNRAAKVLPVYERGLCQNHNCQFDYCTKCFFNYHNAHPCAAPIKKTKTDKVGSKKSKKNLKRL